MDQSLGINFSSKSDADVKVLMKETDRREKSTNCNKCNYTSYRADKLKTHLKIHSGEKPNKCNQCNYASHEARNLTKHLKIHRPSGEKPNKCNQCNYASSHAHHLRTHMKMHTGEKTNKCN